MSGFRYCVSVEPLPLAFWLQQKLESSSDRLSLFGLMVRPVQRFPQFIMLLQVVIIRLHVNRSVIVNEITIKTKSLMATFFNCNMLLEGTAYPICVKSRLANEQT